MWLLVFPSQGLKQLILTEKITHAAPPRVCGFADHAVEPIRMNHCCRRHQYADTFVTWSCKKEYNDAGLANKVHINPPDTTITPLKSRFSPFRTANMLTPWQANWTWRTYWAQLPQSEITHRVWVTKFLLSRWSCCSLTIISGMFGRPKYGRNGVASVKTISHIHFLSVSLKRGCLLHLS